MVIRYDSNLCHGKSCHERGFYIMVSKYRKGKAGCHPTLEFKRVYSVDGGIYSIGGHATRR
jgi:hypothetical protein